MDFLALIACSVVFAVVSSYPNQPPHSACVSLTPEHPASSDTGAAPYQLTVTPAIYGPGEAVTVTITNTSSVDFRGFMVQARRKTGGSTDPVGTFTGVVGGGNLLMSCGAQQNTWAHSDRNDKSSMTATWTAPASTGEALVFHYTIVQKNDNTGSVYYTGLMTDLQYNGATVLPTTMGPTTRGAGTQAPTTRPSTTSNAGYLRASLVTSTLVLFVIAIFRQFQ